MRTQYLPDHYQNHCNHVGQYGRGTLVEEGVTTQETIYHKAANVCMRCGLELAGQGYYWLYGIDDEEHDVEDTFDDLP